MSSFFTRLRIGVILFGLWDKAPLIPRKALRLRSCLLLPPPLGRFGGGDERGGERFVEGKEVFHSVPVAGERLGPVTAVHHAVQVLVRLEQSGKQHLLAFS